MIFFATSFLAGIVLAVIESTFMPAAELAGIRPDLVVLAVVVATCRTSFGRVMALAFVLGLTRDFFSGGLVGMSSFSLICVAFVLFGAEEYLLSDIWRAQVIVVFIGSAIFGTLIVFLKVVAGYEVTSAVQILKVIGGTAAYTAVLAPAGFALTKKTELPSYMRLKKRYGDEHETLHQTEI